MRSEVTLKRGWGEFLQEYQMDLIVKTITSLLVAFVAEWVTFLLILRKLYRT
jgi:hypothetical protein